MNIHPRSLTHSAGLTLIEIMVALVISVFLIGGVIQVYLGNKAAYRFSDASSRVQENGRFALEAITSDLRLAGFFGCVDIQQNPSLVQNHLDISNTYPAATYGFTTQPSVVLASTNGGSDTLTIKGSQPGQVTLSADLLRPGNGDVTVTGSMTFNSGDIVLITNCWTSDIFEVSGADTVGNVTTITHTTADPAGSPGNTNVSPCAVGHCLHGGINPLLERDYLANATSVYKLQNVVYSIGVSGSGSNEPALFRFSNSDVQAQELIEGVESMVTMYGVDTTGDGLPNQYLTAGSVIPAGQTITSIRIWLVVRSENDRVLDNPQSYVVNGQRIVAQDQRLRQVFSTTIDLRNQ